MIVEDERVERDVNRSKNGSPLALLPPVFISIILSFAKVATQEGAKNIIMVTAMQGKVKGEEKTILPNVNLFLSFHSHTHGRN